MTWNPNDSERFPLDPNAPRPRSRPVGDASAAATPSGHADRLIGPAAGAELRRLVYGGPSA